MTHFFQKPYHILGGKAKRFLDDKNDLVAIKSPGEVDYLSSWLRRHWMYDVSLLVPFVMKPSFSLTVIKERSRPRWLQPLWPLQRGVCEPHSEHYNHHRGGCVPVWLDHRFLFRQRTGGEAGDDRCFHSTFCGESGSHHKCSEGRNLRSYSSVSNTMNSRGLSRTVLI